MGFLDKAKKLAEQAQSKLDEVRKPDDTAGTSDRSGPLVEYDKHGRPIRSEPPDVSTPPHGDPLAGAPPIAATPGLPQTEPPSGPPPSVEASTPPPAPPGLPDTPAPGRPLAGGADDDRDAPDHAPPKLTGGDPLAG